MFTYKLLLGVQIAKRDSSKFVDLQFVYITGFYHNIGIDASLWHDILQGGEYLLPYVYIVYYEEHHTTTEHKFRTNNFYLLRIRLIIQPRWSSSIYSINVFFFGDCLVIVGRFVDSILVGRTIIDGR